VPLDVDVIRDRNTLYRETPEGLIENVYTLKILNMDARAHRFALGAEGIEQLEVVRDDGRLVAKAGEVVEIAVRLRAPPQALAQRSQRIEFTLQAQDEPRLRARKEARFLGPEPSR